MNEPIYTQEDIDIATNALFALRQENVDLMHLIWALIISAGGSVGVTRNSLIEAGTKGCELIKIDDHVNHVVIYKAVKRSVMTPGNYTGVRSQPSRD